MPQPRENKEKELISQKWVVLSEVTSEKEQALSSRKKERASVNKERVTTPPGQVGIGWLSPQEGCGERWAGGKVV